ncbi:hypothetical protein LCGC14_2621790, partial [marine sediment metagenome]
ESLQKDLGVPMLFRKQMYEELGKEVTGLTYEEFEKGMNKIHSFRSQIYNLLQDSKIFILEEDIAQMLYLTDNEIFPREIPFDNFFLETSFELKNGTIVKGIHIYKEPKKGFIIASVRLYSRNLPPSTMSFDLFAKNFETLKVGNKFFDKRTEEGSEVAIGIIKNKKIQTFICNFLDFLNDPEVELRTIERSEKNRERRIKNGKIPIPPINFIRVTGKLKIYQDNFRRLQDEERYREQAGKRIWIKPYIKGKGILKDKSYKIKKEVRNSSHA